jgi:formate dehydrogenase subunit gamma
MASAPTPARVLRFTRSERAFHWLVAVAFFSMLISGLVMGKRGSFHNLMYAWHLASAGVLVLGAAAIVLIGNRRALARTSRDLSTIDALDREWLARVPAALVKHRPEPPAGRFNAGQKVNFMLVALLFAALLVSGIGLLIAGSHPTSPVFKAAHVLAAYAALILVAGHIYMATINLSTRPALRGMLSGEVDATWVRRYHTRPGEGGRDREPQRAHARSDPPASQSPLPPR